MNETRRRWPLETVLGNAVAIPLLGIVSYAAATWNAVPWAGVLHGLTTTAIAWCGCNVGIILTRDSGDSGEAPS